MILFQKSLESPDELPHHSFVSCHHKAKACLWYQKILLRRTTRVFNLCPVAFVFLWFQKST